MQATGDVYDAILYKLMHEEDLSSDTIFECQLVLPDTDYQLIQRLNFQPSKIRLILPTLLFRVTFLCFFYGQL